LAGLSATLDLVEMGYEVTIFERSRLLGGRATSFELAGREVDNGQHVFLGCCTAFVEFAGRLKMGDRLHFQDRFEALVLDAGRAARLRAGVLPAPWHVALSFLAYRHVAWWDRVAIARALLDVRSAKTDGGTFAAWLARHGQSRAAVRAFWEPFVVPALNAPLAEIDAAQAAFVLETAFLSGAAAARFGWTTVPLARFAEAAARRAADVQRASAVTAVEPAAASVMLRLANGGVEDFDAVVLALPPPALRRVLGEPDRFGIESLESYDGRPIVDVHVRHDAGDVGFSFAALLGGAVQWVFAKEPGYACASISAAGQTFRLRTAEIVERTWSEMRGAIPALRGAHLLESAVTRNPDAAYLRRPGARAAGNATAFANVALAGGWTEPLWPDTMEAAVRSGRTAAARLQRALGAPEGRTMRPADLHAV
jgi:squalene-associated FAD-dependent desaturase